MKNIVSVQEILEFDIKPRSAVAEWRRLVDREIQARWSDRSGWVPARWPTCKAEEARPAFERSGVAYVESPLCGSLFAALRPDSSQLSAWYRESEPARFWREKILPGSEVARREKVHRPRADWILDGIAEYAPRARRLVDISTHGRGLVDLIADYGRGLTEIVAAGVTADLEGGDRNRVKVQASKIGEIPAGVPIDVAVAVDLLDRAPDLGGLVKALEGALAPGGLLFATVAVASGFEIQTLWELSDSIVPPDKLNLPSVDGLQQIFTAPSWEWLELSTPGMFDAELVLRALKQYPQADWPRVVRALVERTDAAGRMALVEFLQARRLASIARLVVRRKG